MATVHLASDKLDGDANSTPPTSELHHRFQRARRSPGQMELGATAIVEGRKDVQRQVVASAGLANSQFRHNWEGRYKSDLLSALIAEMLGVWFYVIAGQAATATLVFSTVAGAPQGSLLMVGFAYAFGIMFAINVCAPTSGGHFHPAMTIAQVIFRGFPLKKAPLYILSQTFGAFLASLMVYASCRSSFTAYTAKLVASGHREAIFTPAGPAGTIAIFPSPGRDLAEIFANEFFADFLIALVIWSQLDAQNVFASPAIAPYTIGLAFAVVIWGMSYQTVVANSARDVGSRLACAAIWGSDCFPAKYSALAALTNIASSLFAITVYTFFLSDSRRPPAQHTLGEMHEAEKARHDLSRQRHSDILDQRITRTMSKGGDITALMVKQSRLSKTATPKSIEESEG